MRANLDDAAALVQETRECALHYAMSDDLGKSEDAALERECGGAS